MENQNHKMDEIFRQRLHDAEVPPPPFVWPAVEQELRKRRRRLVFIYLFALSTLAAGVWLLLANPWPQSNPSYSISPTAGLHNNTEETSRMPAAESSSQRNLGEAEVENSYSDSNSKIVTSAFGSQHTDKKYRLQLAPSNLNVRFEQSSVQPAPIITPEQSFQAERAAIRPVFIDLPETKTLKMIPQTPKQQVVFSPKIFQTSSRQKKAQPKFCYDFTRHPSAWLLEVYGGPSLAQGSLTSRLDDIPYLNQRLSTERRSTAMNAGIRASLMFNSNLLVRTGLHYDQITEIFEYIDPTSVIYILKFLPGNPVPDTLGVEYGENYLKTYNRYQMLDVPLLVGVEMRQGRSGFSINAGLSANIMFKKRGAIMDPLYHEPARFGQISDDPKAPGPKTPLSQEVFRTHAGLSANASIQWYWHLNPHFRVFVEPSFRQILRPITLGNHPVEQRYSILGLRLGATKIF